MHDHQSETPSGAENEPIEAAADTMSPEVEAAEQAGGPAGELASLKAEIEKLTQERKQLEDQLLRNMAEFQNFRKRKDQEAEQIRQFATEKLVTGLLPVLDNFERTVAALEGGAPIDSVAEGIRLIDRQFRSVLEGQNVRRIDSHGKPFDPDFHEAIATDDSHELPENTVTTEVEAGYRMADKVIRPARVRVSKKP